MLKSTSDYFSFHAVKGSSPTTSLAADLSQNFHIEQRSEQRWRYHELLLTT